MSELKKPQKKYSNEKMKYISMAYELLVLILILVFLGKFIDQKFEFEKAYFTMGLTIIGFSLYFIKMIRDLK